MTEALLGGRYRLDHLIGRGGMAAVWSATDTVLGRPVAVKRLHAGLLADREHAERFRREAMLVARLSHPNLVHLLDRGEDPEGPYLVMELVEGENLKTRIRREGALDPDEAARICAGVGRALSYAHGQGVVHRDIKAQNVLLDPDGSVKLADFGIARLLEGDGQPGLTATDMLMGSADYLSPEQADGRPLDGRTDVYSLGILLYECVTGTLPFRGEGFVAVAMKHCNEALPDPREAAPGVPDRLAAVIARAAAKEPDDRFASAAEMVAALESRGEGTVVMPPPVPPRRRAPAAADEGDTARAPRRRRGRRAAATLLVLLLIGAAAAGGAWFVSRDDGAAADATGLGVASVQDFDPQGGDGERPDQRELAVDGDTDTAWFTETYRDSPAFGGLKTGVGLLLTLDVPAVVTEMVVSTPTPGAGFQVLGPEDAAGERTVLAEGSLDGVGQTVALAATEPVGEIVVWITSLVDDGEGGYRAGIGEVQLRGVPNPS